MNVGTQPRIKMDALRVMYEGLGFEAIRIVGQVGSVVFEAAPEEEAATARRIEEAFRARFGFHSTAILRTAPQFRKALGKNPFTAEAGQDPGRVILTCFDSAPGKAARDKMLALPPGEERFHLVGRDLYTHFPNGMGTVEDGTGGFRTDLRDSRDPAATGTLYSSWPRWRRSGRGASELHTGKLKHALP